MIKTRTRGIWAQVRKDQGWINGIGMFWHHSAKRAMRGRNKLSTRNQTGSVYSYIQISLKKLGTDLGIQPPALRRAARLCAGPWHTGREGQGGATTRLV